MAAGGLFLLRVLGDEGHERVFEEITGDRHPGETPA